MSDERGQADGRRSWVGPPPSGSAPPGSAPTGPPPPPPPPPSPRPLPARPVPPGIVEPPGVGAGLGARPGGGRAATSRAVDARPLRFSDILDGSFALFRSSMRVVVTLVLIVTVPVQLLSAFLQRETFSIGFAGLLDDPAAAALLFGEGGGSSALVVTLISQVVVVPLLTGALVHVAHRRYHGHDVSVGETAGATARRAGWLLLANLVAGVVRFAPVLLVIAFAIAGSPVAATVAALVALLLAAGLTPLVVLVVPAIVEGTRPPPAAFRHAVTLARRSYLRTTGVVVGTAVVFNLLALLLAGLPNVVGIIGGFGFSWVLVAAASVLSQLIVAPLTAAAMVLLHADLRIRQEGMDFDLLIDRMRATA